MQKAKAYRSTTYKKNTKYKTKMKQSTTNNTHNSKSIKTFTINTETYIIHV